MQSILYGGVILLVEVPRGPLERSFLSSADASRPLAELPLTHLKILLLLFSMEISIIIVEKFDDASGGVCLLQPLLTVLLFRIALGPISSCRLLMPSIDIYVQVTVTPHDLSGRPSDSPQTAIVEGQVRELKGIAKNRHMPARPPMNNLPNILRPESVRTRWQGPGSIAPCVGWSNPSPFPNARRGWKRARRIVVMMA
jgi:hypothetical protein